MNKFNLTVSSLYAGQRLDVFLSLTTDLTRSHIKKLVEEDCCLVNGKVAKVKYIVKENDAIEFTVPDVKGVEIKANDEIELDIVYQDNDIAVINKQQGLTVHAGNGTGDETLVNALIAKLDSLSGINGEMRPGIVHRIDKNTSGLLVVAKNDKAHVSLASQIEKKECKRIYIALLEGVVKEDEGRIETFIGRDSKDRTKMAVTKFGRTAITDFKVIKRFKQYTLCEFSLQTGRTHQIRVHSKHMGHPIVGDLEYGYKNQKFKLDGQLLHATKLVLTHPTSCDIMTFEAPIPQYFEKVLSILK